MSRASKKQAELKLQLPDQRYLNYVTQAHSIINHYRAMQKQPMQNLDTYLLNTILEGSKSVHEFYLKQLEAQKNAQEATDSVDSADNASARESGDAATGAQAYSESEDVIPVGP